MLTKLALGTTLGATAAVGLANTGTLHNAVTAQDQEAPSPESPALSAEGEAPVNVAPPGSFEVEVRELFRSSGDQPAFWAAYSRSGLARVPQENGVVTFNFDLKEIATVLGAESETQFLVEDGADLLTVEQDSASQAVRLGTRSAITEYVNRGATTLEPWVGEHEQVMTPFEASAVPSVTAGELMLYCSSEELTVDDRTFLLTTYRASDHAFQVGEATALMSYRGLAIIDPLSGLVYHSVFEQKGAVTNGIQVSNVDHQVVLTLLDRRQGGELALILPARLQDQVNSYRFSPRTDESPLNPTLETNAVRPEWSIDLWLSGRVAEMTMGMIAEQGTNPLPVAALGGLVLSDQAISYGGTKLVEQRKIDLGEDDPRAPKIDRVESPLERAYGQAPFGERLSVLTPETTGLLKIEGQEAVAVGALFLLTKNAFSSSASSSGLRLEFATSGSSAAAAGVPVYGVVAADSAVAASKTLPALLLIGAGGVIATGGSGGGGSVTPPGSNLTADLTYNQAFVTGCNVGGFELTVTGADAGSTWRLEGNGAISSTSTCSSTGSWFEVDQGVAVDGQTLLLSIPTPPHGCINGSVVITQNGAPVTIRFLGQELPSGTVSNPCF